MRLILMPRWDSHFQIIERFNDNVCKLDLLGEYGVSATFNVFYISLFDVNDDSRMNPFYKRGNDVIQATPRYLLEVLVGPVTRFRVKRFKETFNGLLQDIWAKMDFKKILNNKEQVLINIIHVKKKLVARHSKITKRFK